MTHGPHDTRRPVMLDHIAIATRHPADGKELFGSLLKGVGAHSGRSIGFSWRQCAFPEGPKVEVLHPTDPEQGAFLERFLSRQGPGFHHYNFDVPDLVATLEEVKALGMTPLQVHLDDPVWKEAFLHPNQGHGMVIQIVQHTPPPGREPDTLVIDRRTLSHVTCIEHHVRDLAAALRLFTGPLGGRIDTEATTRDDVVELIWPNRARVRLVAGAMDEGRHPEGAIDHLEVTQAEGALAPSTVGAIREVADRLGVTLRLVTTSR